MVANIKNDFGNSTNKMYYNGKKLVQPSTIKRLTEQPAIAEGNLEKHMANLFDELTVNITSPALKRSGFFSVGKRANLNIAKTENMNIRIGEKHKHDIPVIMNLSMTAAAAIAEYYEEHAKLPVTLSIEAKMTGAIPASEWKPATASMMEKRFTNNGDGKSSHVVIVYIGTSLVTVTINYISVKITQEGVPAIYALREAPTPKENKVPGILDKLVKEYKGKKGREHIANLTQVEIAQKKGLLTDIGSGTTELIHLHGANPVIDNCTGVQRGVGHAAEEAAKALSSDLGGHLQINRQRFDDLLLNTDDNLHESAIAFMDDAKYVEAQNILEIIKERYIVIGGDIEYFMVLGGGSITFESELYSELVAFAEEVHCFVLWIPAEYAVDMNLEGLSILHDRVFFPSEVVKS
ncbi:ParM/StbA family protein [Paenibacillus sp. FSL L8-0494]|uniref:ParM/StbA family protein n=1 Tax=Paenibacillus sp. FSL L8-0494 TaxID=2975352 RepID=UPI0030F7E477